MKNKLLIFLFVLIFLFGSLNLGSCTEPVEITGLNFDENIKVTGFNTQGKFNPRSGMNEISCSTDLAKNENCFLDIQGTKFENFKGGPIILDKSGEIEEAKFKVENPGGEYKFGETTFKINSGEVYYNKKTGILELPEGAVAINPKGAEKPIKLSGNNLKYLQNGEEHSFNGDLNFDKDGIPYIKKEDKLEINGVKLSLPKGLEDSDKIKIFTDGKIHDINGGYISFNEEGAILKGPGNKESQSWKGFTADFSKSKLFENPLENNKFTITPSGGAIVSISKKKGKNFPTVTSNNGDAFTIVTGKKEIIFRKDYEGTYIRRNPTSGDFSSPEVAINTLQTSVFIDENQNLYTTSKLKILDYSVTSPTTENEFRVAKVLYSPGDPKRFFNKDYQTFKKVGFGQEILNKEYEKKIKEKYPELNINDLKKQAENFKGTREKFIQNLLKKYPHLPYLNNEESTDALKSKGIHYENYQEYLNDFNKIQKELNLPSTTGSKEEGTNLYGIRNAIWGKLLGVQGYYYYDSPRNFANK